MSQLILQLQDGEERIVPFRRGETLTLGRDSHHAIVVDNPTVSRLHAQFTCSEDGACWLEDFRSSNGTTLNNTRITQPAPLQDGDRLGFGAVTAIYLAPDGVEPPARGFAAGDLFAGCYQLKRSLGETDEYETFCAEDQDAGAALVAVTIFVPGTIAGAGGFEVVRRQFARVRAAPHPGLVRLTEFARWRGVEYLVSEWIEGRTLLDLLRRRGTLALSAALRLAGQVATATDHARAHGLPTPDLALRAVLLSLRQPLPPGGWEHTLNAPDEHWAFITLKTIPRLFAPVREEPWPLGTLLCDLLGHPPARSGMLSSCRIACLGEEGNAVLARRFAADDGWVGSDASFVAELVGAVGLSFQIP